MFNKISFIGAGSMAEAIISGIIKRGFLKSEQIYVTNHSNKERLSYLSKKYNVCATSDKIEVIKDANVIILAMKPADIESVTNSIKEYVKTDQLVISVAAGIDTESIETFIGKPVPIIRVMPNTSASIGYSATAITKGRYATENDLHQSMALFNTIGITEIVSEEDMHTVTGISGSGPAYIYYLFEAMEKIAIETGLDEQVAKSLITETIIGAGEMLKSSEDTAQILREKVTSPGGTTEAGINTLKAYDFDKAIIECIKSARNRSIELGKK